MRADDYVDAAASLRYMLLMRACLLPPADTPLPLLPRRCCRADVDIQYYGYAMRLR